MKASDKLRQQCNNVRASQPPAATEIDPDKAALDSVLAAMEHLRGKRNKIVQRMLAKTGELPPITVNMTTGVMSGPVQSANALQFRRTT